MGRKLVVTRVTTTIKYSDDDEPRITRSLRNPNTGLWKILSRLNLVEWTLKKLGVIGTDDI